MASTTPTTAPPPAGALRSTSPPLSTSDPQFLSPLEQQVLDEYAALLHNLNTLNQQLADLAQTPSAEILDALRGLERKTSVVFTLLKASVYSIVLQQQIGEEDAGGESGGGGLG